MCPTSTWFGRITIAIGFILLFFARNHFTEILAYVFIAVSFIYSIFFADKSCSVDYSKKDSDEM